jgi:hypothetical protein
MALTKPALAEAAPGAPITAQAWNDIIGGLGDLYDAVLALGSAVIEVEVTFDEQPISAHVVAEPAGDATSPVVAIPPVGSRSSYLVAGLTPGDWNIRVEAPSLLPKTIPVTVPREEPVIAVMEATGALVPDVFGLGAVEARGVLNDANVSSDRLRIIDTAGQELTPHDISPEHANSEVLVQTPAPGSILASAADTVRLVLAAPLVQTETVTMPSLIGLTINEATEALQAIGLTIKNTEVRS